MEIIKELKKIAWTTDHGVPYYKYAILFNNCAFGNVYCYADEREALEHIFTKDGYVITGDFNSNESAVL